MQIEELQSKLTVSVTLCCETMVYRAPGRILLDTVRIFCNFEIVKISRVSECPMVN